MAIVHLGDGSLWRRFTFAISVCRLFIVGMVHFGDASFAVMFILLMVRLLRWFMVWFIVGMISNTSMGRSFCIGNDVSRPSSKRSVRNQLTYLTQ